MAFILVHASNNMFARTSARRRTVRVLDDGDVYTTGENQKDKAYLRARPGFDEYVTGELAIGWDRAKFKKVGSFHQLVMVGGIQSGRRRGPSRYVAMVALLEIATGKVVIVATHHAIAKADTSHKERRPLRDQGFRGVAATINWFAAKHPGADILLTGDLNTRGRITIFARAKLVEVITPATFGRLRYDRLYRKGAKVSKVRTRRTGTDHKAIVARVDLSRAA